MIKHTMLNIYQADVEKGVKFWKKYFGFQEIDSFPFGDSTAHVLSLGGTYSITFFDKTEMLKYSPEVAENFPSILFTLDNLEEVHGELKQDGYFVSDISPMGSSRTFYFNDGDDNYYAVKSE